MLFVLTPAFRQTPNRISARSIELSEMKSVCPAARASASQRRSLRASSSVEILHAPVSASVTRQSGAPCVTSAACNAACSRKSRVSRRLISILKAGDECYGSGVGELSFPSQPLIPIPFSFSGRAKTGCACVAEVERLVLKVRRLHLNRQMVNAEAVVQFRAQLF